MRRSLKLLWPLLVLAACQSTRTDAVSFIDPDFRGAAFRSLAVEAQKTDLGERRALEFSTADALYARGVDGFPSIKLVSPTKDISDKERRRLAIRRGAEGVLVIVPTHREVVSSRTYVGGPFYEGGVFGGSHHRGAYSGFGVGFPIGSPYDDYREMHAEQVVYEATLYTLPDLRVAWKGSFKTRGPYNMAYDDMAENVAKQIVARLRQDGMI